MIHSPKHRVVLTGVGSLSALGAGGFGALGQALEAGRPAISEASWSRSRKPDATPVIRSFRSYASSICFIASRAISPIA